MILGITPLLSIARNVIQVGGFCLMFLLLDKPRFSWKKTIAGYLLFWGGSECHRNYMGAFGSCKL